VVYRLTTERGPNGGDVDKKEKINVAEAQNVKRKINLGEQI
jgi:hypothetical protein